MECNEIKELLGIYIDGTLSPQDKAVVEAHIKDCAVCRAELVELQELLNSLRALEPIPVPEGLKDEILALLKSELQKKEQNIIMFYKRLGLKTWGRAAGMAAVILFAVGLSFGVMKIGKLNTVIIEGVNSKEEQTEYVRDAVRGDSGLSEQKQEIFRTENAENIGDVSPEFESRATSGFVKTNEQKVIKRAYINMKVHNLNISMARINALAEESGGYVENSSTGTDSQGIRWGSVVLRVPPQKLSLVLKDLRELALNITEEGMSGEDITMVYIDLEARLNNLRKHEERLQDLWQQGKTIEDLIRIEEELSRVRGEIESLTAQQRAYDNLLQLATVQCNIEEEKPLIPGNPAGGGIWEQAKAAFRQTVREMVYGLGRLIILCGKYLPALLVLLLVLMGGYFVFARKRK